MDRKEFIKTCGLACLGVGTLGVLLQSCVGAKTTTASAVISGDELIIPLTDFEVMKNKEKSYKKYLIIENEKLSYPIYIYRFSENDYSAVLMQCTHQGAELTAYGEKLVCSAHGSEFDNRGQVQTYPANKNLRNFPVTVERYQIKISLK